jgi:hypothetical protein
VGQRGGRAAAVSAAWTYYELPFFRLEAYCRHCGKGDGLMFREAGPRPPCAKLGVYPNGRCYLPAGHQGEHEFLSADQP